MKRFSILIILACTLCTTMVAQAANKPKLKRNQVGNHGVSLTWNEATQGTTFNVYRGTAPGGENYAAPYATVGVGILGYLDQVGTPGTTYYYTVTALLFDLESDPSNEASAVFPTVPAAPSGLSAKSQ